MKKIITYLLIAFIANSCVSYKVKNLDQNIEKNEYEYVEFIKNIDNYSFKKKVGDFNVVDLKKDWKEVKSNILKLAKSNYANAIVVEKFELAGKGVKGNFYQVNIDELTTLEKAEKGRKLYIFRDELGSILTTHFRTELSIDGITKKLEDRTFEVIELAENLNSFTITINGKSKDLELTKGDNYFWISRQISGSQTGTTSLNIEIGGQNILKIDDNDMGKIWVSTLK
jgi:hypothetical protein